MHIIIMGCGRVGAGLGRALSSTEHRVVVIDKNESAFTRLGPDFDGRTVVGQGFDRDVLQRAGIETADAFAAVSSGDNSNIIAARVAREMFGVERVIARIYDEGRAAVYERLGIPTVATVPWTTDRFLRALVPAADQSVWRDPSGGIALIELTLDESWIGQRLAKIQEVTGSRIAFVTRFGAPMIPNERTVLQDQDRVVAAVTDAGRDFAIAAAAGPAPASD